MYVFNFFNRFVTTKLLQKRIVIEIGIYKKLLRTTSNSFWLMYFFSIVCLLHSFEISSSNENQLSIVIPNRVIQFSDSISLLSIWSFNRITYFIDFCSKINWNLSGFTIMLLFANQFTAYSDSLFNFEAMCLHFWMQLRLHCHLKNYKYQNLLISLASHQEIY